eukprot:7632460-Karenia_brevis.AAC.1
MRVSCGRRESLASPCESLAIHLIGNPGELLAHPCGGGQECKRGCKRERERLGSLRSFSDSLGALLGSPGPLLGSWGAWAVW